MYFKRAFGLQTLFFYTFVSVPLVYVADYPILTRSIRACIIILLAVLVLVIKGEFSKFRHNFISLTPFTKWLLLACMLLGVIGSIASRQSFQEGVIGFAPEFLGGLSWLSFGILAIYFSSSLIKFFVSKWFSYILLAITIGSLIVSHYNISHGFRAAGLLGQATTMALFAVVSYVSHTHQLLHTKKIVNKLIAYLGVLTAFSLILFTQSRIGYATLAVCAAFYVAHTLKRSRETLIVSLLIVLAICAAPFVCQNYLTRFQMDYIGRSQVYRLSLYKTSVKDVIQNELFIGNGVGSLPVTINNQNLVPEDIKASLQNGDLFYSTHNLFIDYAYYFGALFAFCVLILTINSYWRTLKFKFDIIVICIGFAALANALFNVQSLEFTPYFIFIVIAAQHKKLTSGP